MAKIDMSSPAIHNIGLCGLTGVIFAILTSSLVLYLEGFVTTSWSTTDKSYSGLWQACENKDLSKPDWLLAVQVLASLSLFGVVIAFGLIVIYLSVNRASKNLTIVCLAAASFFTAVFMSTTVIVYGIKQEDSQKLSWSYYVTVVATVLSFIAGILSVIQIRRSNVRL